MLTRQDAYKILGLNEGAGRDEIENRYFALSKQYQAEIRDDTEAEEGKPDIGEINKAYRLLVYGETGEEKEAGSESKNQALGKKIRNNLSYYKYHIIFGIIFLAILGSILKSCIFRVDFDLNVAVLGDFNYIETETMTDMIKEKIPASKHPNVDVMLLTPQGNSQQDVGNMEKSMVVMAVGDVDICILDKTQFNRFAKQGTFENLDELAKELAIDTEKSKDYLVKTDFDTEPHLYGIDINESEFLKQAGIDGKEKVLALRVNEKNRDNAKELFKLLIK